MTLPVMTSRYSHAISGLVSSKLFSVIAVHLDGFLGEPFTKGKPVLESKAIFGMRFEL